MVLDCLNDVTGTAIAQEKDTLPHAPQWGGTKLISTSASLGNVVRQARAHVMDQQVGK